MTGRPRTRVKRDLSEDELRGIARTNNPDLILRNAPEILKYGWGIEAVREAAKRNVFAALEHAGQYMDQPFAQEVIAEAARQKPAIAVKNSQVIGTTDWGRQILDWASIKSYGANAVRPPCDPTFISDEKKK